MTSNLLESGSEEILVLPTPEDIDFLIVFLEKLSQKVTISRTPEIDTQIIANNLAREGEDIDYLEVCKKILLQWKQNGEIPETIDVLDSFYSTYVEIYFNEEYPADNVSDSMGDSEGLTDLLELVRARTIFRGIGYDLPDIADNIKEILLDDAKKVQLWKEKLDLIVQGLWVKEEDDEEQEPTTVELIKEILMRVANIFIK